jgi:Lrp/AsnC family leucine-responsive transcriptional regulator|tara:strand:- start:457 stop:921 length:465 start_codon:yes stop_codon:yes gene_type:complete
MIINNGLLTQTDYKLLEMLGHDGRIPVTELAKRVGMSKSACQVRLKRLQTDGYILGFRAILDPTKLGKDHIAFVEVKLTDTTKSALSAFNEAVLTVPEIEQCHMIAGAFDYLLKVRTRNMKSYRYVLGEVISTLPFVGSTSTNVSMEAIKDDIF